MTRPRLTPHQAEVLADIQAVVRRFGTQLVPGEPIGCAGAVARLEQKGYLLRVPGRGPRGGQRYDILLLTDDNAPQFVMVRLRDYVEAGHRGGILVRSTTTGPTGRQLVSYWYGPNNGWGTTWGPLDDPDYRDRDSGRRLPAYSVVVFGSEQLAKTYASSCLAGVREYVDADAELAGAGLVSDPEVIH